VCFQHRFDILSAIVRARSGRQNWSKNAQIMSECRSYRIQADKTPDLHPDGNHTTLFDLFELLVSAVCNCAASSSKVTNKHLCVELQQLFLLSAAQHSIPWPLRAFEALWLAAECSHSLHETQKSPAPQTNGLWFSRP